MAEVWATLASDASEEIATRFIRSVGARFEPLRHFPLSGPARDELAPGLRVTFHASYAVYYKVVAEAVVIVRVLRGARDVAALAERGGFA